MKLKLLCILGETASGKDAIVNSALEKLSDYKIKKVCSYTDRPMRSNETDGNEHYFVTTEEFNNLKKIRNNDIIAYTHIKNETQSPDYEGYQYMAFKDELDNSHIYIIDYNGLLYLKKLYGNEIDIIAIYIHAPLSDRLKRAEATRSDFQTEFKNRVEAEEAQFYEFRKLKLYDYKIVNSDGRLDISINKMCNIIRYELLKEDILNRPIYNAIKNK